MTVVETVDAAMRTARKETRTCSKCGSLYPNNRAGYYEHRLTVHGIQPKPLQPKKKWTPPPRYYRTKPWNSVPERDAKARAMADLIAKGWTLQQVGNRYDLTRERVRQLLISIGIGSVKDLRATPTRIRPDPICRYCENSYVAGTWHAVHVKTDAHRFHATKAERFGERNSAIAADYVAGMRLSDISMKYGIAFATVYHALRRRGIPKRFAIPGKYDRANKAPVGATKWTVSKDIHEAVTDESERVPVLSKLYGIPQGEIHRLRVAHRANSCSCMKVACDCPAGCTTMLTLPKMREGKTTCSACRHERHLAKSHPNGTPTSRRLLTGGAG